MRRRATIIALIAGTVAVTLARPAFLDQDAVFLEFIDRNLMIIALIASIFVGYCFYLLRRFRFDESK